MKILVTLLLCLGLLGCASDHYLLKTNPARLSDDELLSYFHQVDAEITRLEAKTTQYSSVDQQRPAQRRTADLILLSDGAASDLNALRARRIAVRMELEERGISLIPE